MCRKGRFACFARSAGPKTPTAPSSAGAAAHSWGGVSGGSTTGAVDPSQPVKVKKPKGKLPEVAIGIAAVVVLALVIAGVGFATDWFGLGGPEVKESVNDYTWDELSQISDIISKKSDQNQALEVAKKYNLTTDDGKLDGTQTKDIELSDGTTAKAMIAGFNHDDKSDGSGEAGISFIFTNGVAVKAMFNQSTLDEREENNDMSDIGWNTSDLRTWLESDFLNELPSDLRNAIKPVDKKSGGLTEPKGDPSDSLSYADLSITSDALWIPSICEILDGGKDVHSLIGINSDSDDIDSIISSNEYQENVRNGYPLFLEEGRQYLVYKDAGVSYDKANPIFGEPYDDVLGWWTRSAYAYYDPTFKAVTVGQDGNGVGTAFPYASNDENVSVVPGFCI